MDFQMCSCFTAIAERGPEYYYSEWVGNRLDISVNALRKHLRACGGQYSQKFRMQRL